MDIDAALERARNKLDGMTIPVTENVYAMVMLTEVSEALGWAIAIDHQPDDDENVRWMAVVHPSYDLDITLTSKTLEEPPI